MRRTLPGAFLLALLAGPAFAAPLEIASAWLREPPPGSSGAAIYMELHNRGDAPVAVVGARVESAASAAVHGHRHADGMMRMYPVPRLEIAAGASVRLEPGGYHLMVGGLAAAPRAGAVLPFCLRLEDGAEQCAEARVRGIGE
ncbi:MAG: copper chaperone PCu(A)C [Gammaproteobacteria bacterium]|nr:copper chaperone PCu(A)C [Gammaproteobacteria bacterium]